MDKRKEQTGMFSLQMSACNCITNHNKNWQLRREGERNSNVYRLGSCFLNLKIIPLGNSETRAGKWRSGCFTALSRAVHILCYLKYRENDF